MKSTSINVGMGVMPPTSRSEPALQIGFYPRDSNFHEQKALSPTSVRVSSWEASRIESQSRSSKQTHDSIQVVIPLTSHDEPQEAPAHQESEAGDGEDSGSECQASGDDSGDDSEEGSGEDSEGEAEDNDDPDGKARDSHREFRLESSDSKKMLEAECEDASDDIEMNVTGIDRPVEGKLHDAEENYESRSNGSLGVIYGAEEEPENRSGNVTDQSDTSDEESTSESEPDTIQAQLDNQLTQSSQSLPKLRQQPFSPDRNKIFPKQDVRAKDLRAEMPSLRRKVQEIKRTNQANQEAFKARNLANVQQMKDDAIKSSEPDDSSDEDSTSDQSSSSSEKAAGASDQEGAKIRKELSSKIAELGHNSSPPAETLKPAPQPTFHRKETRILPPPKQIPQRQNKKIGFDKLARQFTPKRP